MIKLIYHIADLHIRNYHFHDQYRKVLNQMIERFKEQSQGYTPEEIRIVIAGDFFHQKISISNEQTMFAAWLLNKLSKIGRVIIIPGNHDFLENNHGRLDSITPVVNLIENPNVTYYRESGVFEDENINWVIYSLYNNNKRPDFTNDGRLHVGVFHGAINGCKTNTAHVIEHGYQVEIFEGCDVVLCGDIHSRQVLFLESNGKKTPIIQPGSVIQQNFGETIKYHGFCVYNVEKGTYVFEDLINDSPYLKFKITDIADIENGNEVLCNLE
jgi:DNA repair exonuclease SbcCD nuclease subunit